MRPVGAVRVVIAEDSGLLRQLLVEALTGRGQEVVGETGTPGGLLDLVDTERPDVAVVDIRMPPTHTDEGLVAAERVRQRHPDVGILVLSHYAETGYALRLLECAARGAGYLVKDRVQDADRLVDALARVAAGEVVVDPEVVQRLLFRPRLVDPLDRLTGAERDVLALMAEGRSNAAIARKVSYSVKTVEKRVTAIADKLGLRDLDADPGEVNIRVLAVLAYLANSRR
jgi:DNA-binding NarL/FixJ family response regulator